MDNVFETLERVSEASGGSGGLPNWLSTHPDPGNRIKATQARLDSLHRSLSGTKVDRAQYMSQINNLVFGEDPREGFFQGNTFYHPELRFRFSIPNGWLTQNTPQAVATASPQQDAIFQLTLAPAGTPPEAANAFFGQQGIQPGNVSNTSVNGLPAVAGYFDAQTDQGVIRGLVSFISYGGKTYQLMGYAGSGNFASYDPTFRQIISSFQQMNDPSILNVQPARIEIVTVPQAMTLAEFNQKYPSSVPIEQVALINELQPDGRIAAGQQVKRVTGGRAP
jgi:predicted Zn-dependent protease